jgi:hypothetical protein
MECKAPWGLDPVGLSPSSRAVDLHLPLVFFLRMNRACTSSPSQVASVILHINCTRVHDKDDVPSVGFRSVSFPFITWDVPGSENSLFFQSSAFLPLAMKVPFVPALSLLACIGLVAGIRPPGMLAPPLGEGDEMAIEATGAINFTGDAFFTQLLDHDNPNKGTFKQKYWYNFQYWKGPGSPVSLAVYSLEVNANCPNRLSCSRQVKVLLDHTVPI